LGSWGVAGQGGRRGLTKGRVRVDLLRMAYKSKRYMQMIAINKLDNDALNV